MGGGMGKKAGAAKKAGAVKKTGVTIPPTKRRSGVDDKKYGSMRSNRVAGLINMRRTKVKRDKNTGEIVKGSVLDNSDKIEPGKMARIAPSRDWFGAPRVIGQDAMQKFKDEMAAKLKDPYSVLVKPAKLPLSLLEEPKEKQNLLEKKQFDFKNTFGQKARRKRVATPAENLAEFLGSASKKSENYREDRDQQLNVNVERESCPLTSTAVIGRDMTIDRKPFDKGQSGRIWGELWKVIDSSDVILQVLDARDPMGTRSKYLENYLQKEKKFKHLVFVLNKVDLVPTWVTARWLQILSKDRPTVAFHASLEHPFGKGNLINLLRQFGRLHGSVKGKNGAKKSISVGMIGYPNVGKSSVINTIRAKKVCKTAPIPGETKVWQYVNLSKNIFLIDCPGVIHDSDHKNNDVEAVLKGVVRVERMGDSDKNEVIQTITEIIKKEDLKKTYEIDDWVSADDFLQKIARQRGKLLRGGVPDIEMSGRMVMHDWIRGRLPWFNAPPFESNQQYRDAQMEDETMLLKKIQNFSSFNIINSELKSKVQQDAEGIDGDEEDEEMEEMSEADSDAEDVAMDSADEDEESEAPAPTKKASKKSVTAAAAGAAPSAWDALRAASASAAAKPAAAAAQKVRLVKRRK